MCAIAAVTGSVSLMAGSAFMSSRKRFCRTISHAIAMNVIVAISRARMRAKNSAEILP